MEEGGDSHTPEENYTHAIVSENMTEIKGQCCMDIRDMCGYGEGGGGRRRGEYVGKQGKVETEIRVCSG